MVQSPPLIRGNGLDQPLDHSVNPTPHMHKPPKANTHTERNSIHLEPAERLRLATQIITGLLTSGHYTQVQTLPGAEDQPDEPQVRRFDWGKDWEANGRPRRFVAHAASDALSLLEELELKIELAALSPSIQPNLPKPVPVRLTPKAGRFRKKL